MPTIILPLGLPHYCLGTITSFWIAKHDITPEAIQMEEFRALVKHEMETAGEVGDRSSFLLMAFGLINATLDLTMFNHSETEWSQDEIRLILKEMIAFASPKEAEKLKSMGEKIVWIDMPLPEWREKIKPGILQMLAAEGIEP